MTFTKRLIGLILLEIIHKFEQITRELVKSLARTTDYFILERKLTLSEGLLCGLGFGRALWSILFGYTERNMVFDYYFQPVVWMVLFVCFNGIHMCGFYLKSFKMRTLAVTGYAVLWFGLFVLCLRSRVDLFGVPQFLCLSIASMFLSANLSLKKDDED